MEIKINQSNLVDMFCKKAKEHSTSFKSGTYNNSDPTYFERYKTRFVLEYGFCFSPVDYEGNGEMYTDEAGRIIWNNDVPDSEIVHVFIFDCTWGLEIKFKTSIGNIGAYWNRAFFPSDSGGEWIMRSKGKKAEEVFSMLFKEMLNADSDLFRDEICEHERHKCYV